MKKVYVEKFGFSSEQAQNVINNSKKIGIVNLDMYASYVVGSQVKILKGPLIGATIGGAIGSIIPGLGTMIGSFIGGAIGQCTTNFVQGQIKKHRDKFRNNLEKELSTANE